MLWIVIYSDTAELVSDATYSAQPVDLPDGQEAVQVPPTYGTDCSWSPAKRGYVYTSTAPPAVITTPNPTAPTTVIQALLTYLTGIEIMTQSQEAQILNGIVP